MGTSEIFNILLGGGLLATVAGLLTLRATVRKANAEADALRIDNTEQATRILMENIVKPLKDEFNETKKELARNTREMARLRKAIDAANGCRHRDHCPVLHRLRDQPKDGTDGADGTGGADGQPADNGGAPDVDNARAPGHGADGDSGLAPG